MKIPPFAGVKPVEFWDRLELRPFGWIRDCVGLCRRKANELFEPGEVDYQKWNEKMGDNEIWVVVNWTVFENEDDEVDRLIYCRPNTSLEDAKKVFEWLKDYLNSSPKDRDAQAGIERYMPFMNGLSAIDSIQRLKPDISIIIASGAKRGPNDLQCIDTTHLTTLNKPYTVEQLLNAVAKAISSTTQ